MTHLTKPTDDVFGLTPYRRFGLDLCPPSAYWPCECGTGKSDGRLKPGLVSQSCFTCLTSGRNSNQDTKHHKKIQRKFSIGTKKTNMVNAPLTPAPSPRTKDDGVLILQMDRERRQKRADFKRSVPWTVEAYPEQISAPILLDEDCQGAKRRCIHDETKRTLSYGSGVSIYTLQPRNLNATFQDFDSPRLNTEYYIRDLPVPISPC